MTTNQKPKEDIVISPDILEGLTPGECTEAEFQTSNGTFKMKVCKNKQEQPQS